MAIDIDNETIMDPKENPVGTGHLPAAGEVGVGPVTAHDPLTADTNDNPEDTPDTYSPEENN
jgi:hypothetical protein